MRPHGISHERHIDLVAGFQPQSEIEHRAGGFDFAERRAPLIGLAIESVGRGGEPLRRRHHLRGSRRCQKQAEFYCATHEKFSAASMLPVPLYFATCGYGHNGRVRSTFPLALCVATMLSGAAPVETHMSTTFTLSKVFGPSPPPQWPIPGSIKRRIEPETLLAPPMVFNTLL